MNILSVVNKSTLKRYLEVTRSKYDIVTLVERYEARLKDSDIDTIEREDMLMRFKNTVVGYVPEYKPKRKRRIPHPLAGETSGLPHY